VDVTLPSGNSVTFRDKMMRNDIIEVRRAMKFVTGPDGSRTSDGAFIDSIRSAIFRCMIVSWTFGPQTPGHAATRDLADRMLGQYLDEDDSMAMDMAVQPWVEKITSDPAAGRNGVVHVASGLRLRAATPADAAALAETGEVTLDEGSGPKRPTPTAISSSAAEGGQTQAE